MTPEPGDPGDARHHLAQLARGGLVGLVGAVVSAVATFATVMVVSNGYDPDTAGRYFSLTSLFLLLLSLAGLGADAGLNRFMLRFELTGRRSEVRTLLTVAFLPPLTLSLLVAAVGLLTAPEVADLCGLDPETDAVGVRLVALALPLATLGYLALAATRALENMAVTALVDGFLRSTLQLVAAAACILLGAGLASLTSTWLAAYAVTSCIALALLGRVRRSGHRSGPAAPAHPDLAHQPTDISVGREFWSFTSLRGIAQMAQMALQRLDIVIITALIGPGEAAIYTAATRFVALGGFGTVAIQQVVQPRFTQLVTLRQHQVLHEVYATVTAWSIAVSWPVFALVAAAPSAYLSLFGPEYADASAVVVTMCLGMALAAGSGPADTLLLMSGRSLTSLANTLVALTIDVVLCFVLIPRIGILGAAVAWTAAVAWRSLAAYVQVRRDLQVRALGPASLLVGLLNLVCLSAPVALLGLVVDLTLVRFVLASLVTGSVYLAVLWSARRRLGLSDLTARG